MIQEYDVVVVGFGGAGAVAALAASQEGASVAVLEKGDSGGGNTQDAGGSLRQIASPEAATEYLTRLSQGGTPPEMIESFVQHTNSAIDWLRELGLLLTSGDGPWTDWKFPAVTHDPFPNVPGSYGLGDRVRVVRESEPHGGSALWEGLRSAVDNHDITVHLDTRAISLCRSATGRVTGVETLGPNGPMTIQANRGLVLACGGFSANSGMQRDFLGLVLPAFGNPDGNTGDGLRLTQSVGADLWHMTAVAAVLGYRIDGVPSAFRHHMYSGSFIYVDQYGRRFVDEMGLDNHAMPWAFRYMDPYLPGYPRIPAYLVFDEAARVAGPIVKDGLGYHRRDWSWSSDNSVEIERGWITRGDSAESIAEGLNLPGTRLEKTINDYNQSAMAGDDASFGRRPDSLIPLTPPFYGIALWPCLLNTQGGPRRDATGAVLDRDRKRIPGLFSAGELGSMWTELYPGGGNLMECIVSGMAAGRSASRAA
jgi:succinate dehydrogenase/fumarate reductase flavoprotein subunit